MKKRQTVMPSTKQAIGVCLLATAVCLLLSLPEGALAAQRHSVSQDVNLIQGIHKGPEGIQVELTSSRPFPVRAVPPVLQVGSHEFGHSLRPSDGSLNTLIFLLEHREFAQLRPGDPTYVTYGQDASPLERWDFGGFQKGPSSN